MRSALILCAALLAGLEPRKETHMTARGSFEVRTNPQPLDTDGGPFGRLYLDKKYHGDLVATAKGHMLGVQPKEGSGAYVVLEQITGTLNGRRGTFMLQHAGHMKGGSMTMTAMIVPDSGTEELLGIAGRLTITITDGKHSYTLEYTLEH